MSIAPFGRVRFRDFFFTDVITSLVTPLKDMLIMFYYLANIKDVDHQENYKDYEGIKIWFIVASIAPYWWRMWQCFNKCYYSGMKVHFFNGMKYFSKQLPPIVLIFLPDGKDSRSSQFACWLTFQLIATFYCMFWDYHIDWGLLRSLKKGHFILRDQMAFPNHFYYMAMAINAFLRFFWIVGLLHFKYSTDAGKFYKNIEVVTFFSMLAEAVRRTQWSVFRVENEFYNNFEQYRTIPIIPKLMDEVDKTLSGH